MKSREMELRFKRNRTEKETQELLDLIRKDRAKVQRVIKILEEAV